MKKLFFLIFTVLFSCSDLIEEPLSQLSPQAIADEKGIESIVAGGYANLATSDLFGGRLNGILMLRGDMVDVYSNTNAERRGINSFSEDDATGRLRSTWRRFFQVIASANTAIDGAKNMDDEDGMNRILGESRFLRAFAYYHLVRLFGDVPIVDFQANTSELADGLNDLPRESIDKVYNELIIPDLEFAKEFLPEIKNGGSRTRASKGTAAGMLASVYLTLGQHQEAYNEAKFVIDNKDKFGYELEENFQDIFNASKTGQLKEPMLAIAFTSQVFQWPYQDDILGATTGIPIAGDFNGWGAMVPTMAVYESFDPEDYRTSVSFQTEVTNDDGEVVPYTEFPDHSRNASQPAIPHIAKFRRFPGNMKRPIARETDYDYVIMRYAEVLLIAAEASNQLNGPSAEAVGYINQLRERARKADGTERAIPANLSTGLSQQELHDAIIEERRIELAFEYKRWYDIARLKIGEEVFKGPNSLEPQANFNANRYLFALPADQLNFNQTWEQNPGY